MKDGIEAIVNIANANDQSAISSNVSCILFLLFNARKHHCLASDCIVSHILWIVHAMLGYRDAVVLRGVRASRAWGQVILYAGDTRQGGLRGLSCCNGCPPHTKVRNVRNSTKKYVFPTESPKCSKFYEKIRFSYLNTQNHTSHRYKVRNVRNFTKKYVFPNLRASH